MIEIREVEQHTGLRTFVNTFFRQEITDQEAADLMALLKTGEYAARDIPRLLAKARQTH